MNWRRWLGEYRPAGYVIDDPAPPIPIPTGCPKCGYSRAAIVLLLGRGLIRYLPAGHYEVDGGYAWRPEHLRVDCPQCRYRWLERIPDPPAVVLPVGVYHNGSCVTCWPEPCGAKPYPANCHRWFLKSAQTSHTGPATVNESCVTCWPNFCLTPDSGGPRPGCWRHPAPESESTS